jgi:hypothetical protein
MTHRLSLVATCGVSRLEKGTDREALEWLKTSTNDVDAAPHANSQCSSR